MQIFFKKSFIKQYQKLPKNYRSKVDTALIIFEKDPYASQLKNHSLIGTLEGKRSIAAGFDLRIIFEEKEDYTVVLVLGVGTHNQVY